MLRRFLFTFSIATSIIIIFSVIVTQKREERRALEAEQRALAEKVDYFRKENERLKKESKALVNDPIQIEREARDNGSILIRRAFSVAGAFRHDSDSHVVFTVFL